MSDALEKAIVAALGGGTPPGTMASLRQRVGGSARDLTEAVRRLRYQGKIMFDRLELSPSMRVPPFPAAIEDQPERGEGVAQARSRTPAAAPSPVPEPEVTIAQEVAREADAAVERRRQARKIGGRSVPDTRGKGCRDLGLTPVEHPRLLGADPLRCLRIAQVPPRLPAPVPFSGKQGFFDVPDELLRVPMAEPPARQASPEGRLL